jgi:tetratricopeptide (TPR) repeat protein
MEPVTASELAAALAVAVGRPQTWAALRDLVPGGELPVAGGGAAVRELAESLAAEARGRPQLMRELRLWVAGVAGGAGGGANAISGDASIDGPVVQARDIQGGIHFHGAAADRRHPVPRQLPPVPAHFTGRESELAALGEPVGPLLTVISGPAGVGKTALAARWLSAVAGEYPDGQLYADLRGHSADGPARPGEVLGQFLRAFGADHVPAEAAEQAAMWRTVTAGLKVVVLLDNALSAAQVRPLLPGGSGSLVAVTSRRRLAGLGVDGAVFRPLAVMDPDDAVELLTRRIGAERVRREPEAARRVAVLCAGLPLAVCVAGARMAARPRQPLAVMAGALGGDVAGSGGALGVLRIEGDGGRAVQTALDESYRSLAPAAARGYRLLGLPPVRVFDAPVAAAACALAPAEVDRVLDELVEVNLIEDLAPDRAGGPERFRFHDLVRAHAGRLAGIEDTAEDRRGAVHRVVDLYLATASAAEALLTPSHVGLDRDAALPPGQPPSFTDGRGALDWLDAERQHLMAALRTAADQGWDDTAWQLADALWPLFLRLRPYDLWIEAHEIGLAAARRARNRAGESRMLTSGGIGLQNAGRYDEAVSWFGLALEEARRDGGDPRGEAQALHGIGQSHRLAGRLAEAEDFFVRALALRETIGYRRGAALTRVCLGDVALAAGRPGEAIAPLERARADLLAESDVYDAARALAFLGRARADEGRLRDALAEFGAAGSGHWQARVLEFLGETAQERGDAAAARDRFGQSLAGYEQLSAAADAARLRGRLRDLSA